MADVELRLVADVDQATKGVRGFSKEYQALVRDLAKPLKQVAAFRELEGDLEKAERQTSLARESVRDLGNELARTAEPSRQLVAQYRQAVNELKRLERSEEGARTQLASRRRELQAAGVDTRNLAGEQQRLARELEAATAGGRNDQAVAGIRARAAALAQVTREQRAANLESARQDLGINRYRQLQAELQRVRGQYQLLRTSGNLTTQELALAQRTMTARVRETQQALREMNAEQRRGMGALSGVGLLAAGYGAARGLRGVTNTADQWMEINDRIRLASESQAEHAQGMDRLREISDRTYTDMKNNAELYIGSLSVLRGRGFSSSDALDLTEAIGLGLVASAAKGERAASVINQLNTALQDGELRGDAFNSVIRNTPALADALARGLGKTREQLAAMAKEGELTTDIWVPALIGQVDSLGDAVDSMQVTVGDALTRLNNAWEEAIGRADTQPLISAIEGLTQVISDPVVIDNLVALAGALVTLTATAAEGGSEFVDLGKRIGFIAANSVGAVAELDRIDQQIKDIDRSLAGTGLNRTLAGLWYSKEELQAQRQALVAMRELFVTEQTGMNAEQRKLEDERREEAKRQQTEQLADYRKYISDLGRLQGEQVKAAEAAAKKLASAEKKALRDIEQVRGDRLKIEQRYQEALAGLGGGGEASYGAAQALKVGARQALSAGDVEGAQRQAQAALKMLQDLQAAGANTYGFEGFIKELQGIELAANDLEQTNAEAKLQAIRDEIAALGQQAKDLQDIPVSVKTDEATVEQVRTQIQALAQRLGQTEIVLPVRVQMPDTSGAAAPAAGVPGFSGGGWTGPGGKYQPAGVVHAGEHVQPQEVVREPGALAFLERIRRNGFRATLDQLQLRGYANGGPVVPVPRFVPNVPAPSPALLEAAAGPSVTPMGSLSISIGGSAPVTVQGPPDALRELSLAARKFGRTHR
ncbi:hypothetical protein DN820_01785 [Stutzerimonas nosocomialis]|uniref:Tape measure protein N-terminal domain-containing protein n=1 Tax=Stutzerimonas nosocomialis TaxID=1056496 RepID=A0A5R9QIY6_9GAMM|nr:tape measure protein [Stutzerimonas nosocomialis]TLX65068.1 hypothetical protein DN820_01785 [Stutzerimonas nosocomialis]